MADDHFEDLWQEIAHTREGRERIEDEEERLHRETEKADRQLEAREFETKHQRGRAA